MGTTLDTLSSGEGMQVAFVLAIEGMPYLLTTSADTAAAVTAWAGTPWSTVYAGLQIKGSLEQSIEPWQREIKSSELIFVVQPVDDSADAFGVDVHKIGGGSQTELRSSIGCNDTTIPVMEHANLTSPVWIGTERITYSGTSGTSAAGTAALTGATRGTFHPFDDSGEGSAGDANRFGRDHTLPSFDYDVKYRPRVTTVPRTWIGRWVGLWAHRIVGTTWDVKAQAQRIFAGKIKDIQDTTDGGGATQLVCEDVFSVIRDTTLLHDQFRGRVKEGVYIRQEWYFEAEEKMLTAASAFVANDAADLTVEPSGASGANQINAGYYTVFELIDALNAWLADEHNTDVNLDGAWSLRVVGADGPEPRVEWTVQFTNATAYFNQTFKLRVPPQVLTFLGFEGFNLSNGFGELTMHTAGTDKTVTLSAAGPPLKVGSLQWTEAFGDYVLDLESSQGTWFDNQAWLPEPIKSDHTTAGENWGILQVGPIAVVGRYVSATSFTGVALPPGLNAELGNAWIGDARPSVALGDPGYLEVRQIVILEGKLADIVARLFASTGTSGYNHTTYDSLPAQLGCAIPWDLFGDNFTTSLSVLEQDSSTNALRLVIEKPVKLTACLVPELLLRGAFLVWKNQGMRFTQWATPVAGVATHTLTEANKGSSLPDDPQLAPTQISDRDLVNVVKVEYNRKAILDGAYRDTYEFRFAGSIADYGESKPFTIEARNSYAGNTATGDTVQDLVAALIGKYVPMWGRPIPRMQRTININFFEDVAPGDIALVTDEFMRDPSTGTRGVVAKPALIVRHGCKWWDGELYGVVELAFLALDNVPIYSPSAYLIASGYAADTPSAGKSQVNVEASYFTYAGEAADASHFAAGDKVTVYEFDDPGGAPQSWTVGVDAVAGSLFTFDANLAGFDTAGKYLMTAQVYTANTTAQKTKAFQADDLDLRISDARDAYEYGHDAATAIVAAEASSVLPDLIDTSGIAYGDGRPVTPAIHRTLGRFIANFIDYKSAVSMPVMVTGTPIRGPAAITWRLHWCMPAFAGIGILATQTRSFSVAPILDSTSTADQVECRVTWSLKPPTGSSLVSVVFAPPYKQITFTHQSTTQAIKTAQDLRHVVSVHNGRGFLSVELRAAAVAGPSQIDFLGLAEFRQKARA